MVTETEADLIAILKKIDLIIHLRIGGIQNSFLVIHENSMIAIYFGRARGV